jgi:hypothetical protein
MEQVGGGCYTSEKRLYVLSRQELCSADIKQSASLAAAKEERSKQRRNDEVSS